MKKPMLDLIDDDASLFLFSKLSFSDLLKLSQTNKKNYQLVNNAFLWQCKIQNDFLFTPEVSLSSKKGYKKINSLYSEFNIFLHYIFARESCITKPLHEDLRKRYNMEQILILLSKDLFLSYLNEEFPIDKHSEFDFEATQRFLTEGILFQEKECIKNLLNDDVSCGMDSLVKLGMTELLKLVLHNLDGQVEALIGEKRLQTLSSMLITSIVYQRFDIMEMLIKNGCDLNLYNNFRFDPKCGENDEILYQESLTPLSAAIVQLITKLDLCFSEDYDCNLLGSIKPKWLPEIRKNYFLKKTSELISKLLEAGSDPFLPEPVNGFVEKSLRMPSPNAYFLAQNVQEGNYLPKEIDLKTRKEVELILDKIIYATTATLTEEVFHTHRF